MPNIGPVELVIILVIALLVIGPGKLPDVGSALGKSIREFRKAATDVQESVKLDATNVPVPTPAPIAPVPTPAPIAPVPTPAPIAPVPTPAPIAPVPTPAPIAPVVATTAGVVALS